MTWRVHCNDVDRSFDCGQDDRGDCHVAGLLAMTWERALVAMTWRRWVDRSFAGLRMTKGEPDGLTDQWIAGIMKDIYEIATSRRSSQ